MTGKINNKTKKTSYQYPECTNVAQNFVVAVGHALKRGDRVDSYSKFGSPKGICFCLLM
jgi:hypothetical protein